MSKLSARLEKIEKSVKMFHVKHLFHIVENDEEYEKLKALETEGDVMVIFHLPNDEKAYIKATV